MIDLSALSVHKLLNVRIIAIQIRYWLSHLCHIIHICIRIIDVIAYSDHGIYVGIHGYLNTIHHVVSGKKTQSYPVYYIIKLSYRYTCICISVHINDIVNLSFWSRHNRMYTRQIRCYHVISGTKQSNQVYGQRFPHGWPSIPEVNEGPWQKKPGVNIPQSAIRAPILLRA